MLEILCFTETTTHSPVNAQLLALVHRFCYMQKVSYELKCILVDVVSVGVDEILQAQGAVLDDSRVRVKTDTASFDEQQRRASAINDIENSDFIQSSFRASRSEVC